MNSDEEKKKNRIHNCKGGKAGQPAPHLARKNVGRVGPPRKVIAG